MTIRDWLAGIGLDEYVPMFEANHIDVATLRGLSDAELKEIGVASLGHRKVIANQLAQDARTESGQVDAGTHVDLPDGAWIHPEGGYFYIPDKGPQPIYFYLSHYIRRISAHQPSVASWIIHNRPDGPQSDRLKFWRDLGTFLTQRAGWLMLWKGQVYTANMSPAFVGWAVSQHQQMITELNWPGDAIVELIDVFATDKRLELRWDELLASRSDYVPESEEQGPPDQEPSADQQSLGL